MYAAYQDTSEDRYAVTRMEIRNKNFTKLVQSFWRANSKVYHLEWRLQANYQ